jgi:hypothetical protein
MKTIISLSLLVLITCFIWLVNIWWFTMTSTPNTSSLFLSPLSLSFSSDSFSLAREQSFGFFTDISNENWRILQQYHVKLFPNYFIENSGGGQENLNKFSHPSDSKGKISLLDKTNFWYGRNFQVEFICPLARRMPSDSMADGPKWVRYVVSTHGSGRNEWNKKCVQNTNFRISSANT